MTNSLEDAVQRIVASMDDTHEQEQPGTIEPEETIHIHYFPDAIVILKEEEQAQVIDSTPVKHTPEYMALLPVCVFLLIIFSTLAFQFYCLVNPPVATITIIPKSQTVTLNGTLQLGRLLNPITISQSQTKPTTGKGHQSAQAATGYLTFYNGQFQSVTIAAGTILTGASGVQIITDQDAYVPAESQTIPPSLGYTTISAQALVPGTKGNIPTGDINQGCCATAIKAVNTASFTGGQDERNFSTVSTQDIHKISTPLKAAVTQSMHGALQGQIYANEQLFILPCTPTSTSDHQPGQEATQVNVTVSQTCSAVAYNSQELATKATAFLDTQAQQKIGAGYSLFGTVHIWVKQVSVTTTPHPLVFLSFQTQGTWIYGISSTAQEQIKHLIAGKTIRQALQLLASLTGIEHASIRLTGFGDDTRLPKNTGYIHLMVFIV